MAPSRSLRSKAKQTRLQFQPLSSSSPTKNAYSKAVQSRLANVRYQGARPRRRTARDEEEERESLPTPQPTSPQVVSSREFKPSSPLSSLRTSPTLPPRFTRIHEILSSNEDDDIVLPSSKRRKLSRFQKSLDMGNTASVVDSSEPNDVDSPSARRGTAQAKLSRRSLRSDNGGITLSSSSPSRASERFSSVEISVSQGHTTAVGSRRSNRLQPTPSRRSTRLSHQVPSAERDGSMSSSQRVVSVDIPSSPHTISAIASPESSNDDVMVTKPTPRGSARRKPVNEDSFIVPDNIEDHVSSEGDVTPRKRGPRKRRNPDNFVVDNDEVEYITSSEDNVRGPSPLKSRKLSRKNKSPANAKKHISRARREKEEIEDDLKDLQDSDQEDTTKKARTRGGPVTTQRDKAREHFELLKRRRAGERAPRIIDSDSDGERADYDDGVDIDNIGEEAYESDNVSDADVPVVLDEEENQGTVIDDDDDFVVEDQVTTGRLGRPTTDIPLQFTSFASAKPRELFPNIVEWMVKNKISPAFNRDDEVYNLSISRIDDQVKAQAGSRLISAAWNATFKYAVLARPGIHVKALPGLDEELIRTCDACNKSNHPARYDFTFSGKAYSKGTLEPIEESDDEDENDAEQERQHVDKISYDEQGHVLPSERTHFYLGRYCAASAEMGHKLTHWKHHLNEQVLSYLEEQGVLSAEAIVSREKLNKKKREKEAENIVDMMDETGMITELWQSFQDDLEDARIGMEGYERKGGRSKGRIGSVRTQRPDGTIGEWADGGKFRKVPARLQSDSEGE